VGMAIAGAGLVIGGLVAVCVPAAAGAVPTTLYAGVSASGSANCSSAANACTLTTALGNTAPGDVVELVTAGVLGTTSTYYSGGFSIGTPGTSAAFPVVIESAPGVTKPILDGANANTVLTVTNNMSLVIDGVTIQHGNALDGGGIANESGGTLTVNRSTFTANTGINGGGAIANGDNGGSGKLTVTGSTFTADTTGGRGGAIDNGDYGGSGALTVTGATFTGNTVGSGSHGGAIDNGDNGGSGTLTVNGSTFTGNSAGGGDGGAIDNGDYNGGGSGTVTVTGSTFTANTAHLGGTIDNGIAGGTAAAADIFAGSCDEASGVWTDRGYNVGSDTSCQNGGTGDATSANLANLLGPLANNGGPTQTVLLLPGNPASGLMPNPAGVLCPVAADQTGQSSPPGAPCNAGALQPHPAISAVKVTGTVSAPVVTMNGTGFGTLANLGPSTPACGGGSGSDYTNTVHISDLTRHWHSGQVCNYVGLFVTSYSNTKIVLHFGSKLVTDGGLQKGDNVAVTVLGATKTIRAPI
jgi:hypothetical protein